MSDPTDPATGHRTFPGADPLSSSVLGSFMRAQHAHRQLMHRKMAARGLPPTQLFCLKEIAHADGINQRDLAEKLSVSRPTLTVMLQKLERAGHITRDADPADQRYTRLHITDQGAAIHEEMHELLGEVVEEIAGPLTDPDKTELVRLLGLLYENMTAALEKSESDRP